ncbi:hypothetical protein L4D20_03315 [Vibrio kyushuensis]|uniref:hypothetical protein n=1 Tax=Vibrio TaxID=662 RepID=UPI003D09CDD1
MALKDSIEALEQQIYIACSEADYDTVNMLEHQLEVLRDRAEHPLEDNSIVVNDIQTPNQK